MSLCLLLRHNLQSFVKQNLPSINVKANKQVVNGGFRNFFGNHNKITNSLLSTIIL